VSCELPVTTSQVITGLPVNCELPVTTSQVITGLPESAQVNTHLVSHASTSEQLMKLESCLTTHCIKDKVQIEQNSSAEILISFHNYTELDQDRCPPVSDITDVHNPCNNYCVYSFVNYQLFVYLFSFLCLQDFVHYKDYVHQ
jgi:hypothetical protein